MEIIEAIRERRSIRAFKPDPVPREVLGELLELALRAPSFANTQPWEFAVVTGGALEAIRQAFLDRAEAREQAIADIPYPVTVTVQLICIGNQWTVIILVADTI